MGSASSLQFDNVSVATIDQRQTAGPGSCCFGGASSAGPSAIPRRNRTATSTPLEADALQQRVYDALPRVRITDLLLDVDASNGLAECFTHQRSGRPAEDRATLLATALAAGTNLA
jgi:hypothetical protein